MKKYLFLIFILFFSIILNFCKPTEEGEQKRFDANLLELEKRGKRYPNLKKLFKQLSKDAIFRWEEAVKIKNKEERAKAFKEVNKFIIYNKIFSNISSLESYITSIKNKVKSINHYSPVGRPDLTRKIIFDAQNHASKLNKDFLKILNEFENASFNDEFKTIQDLERVNSFLFDIQKKLDDTIRIVEKRLQEDRDRQKVRTSSPVKR